MKFRFIGDPNDLPKNRNTSIVVFGYKFKDGEAVDVTDPFVIRKLKGNVEFEKVAEDELKTDVALLDVAAPRRGRPPKAKEAQE